MISDLDYKKRCMDIYTNGGVLWLIERIDTNQFCYKKLIAWQSNIPETRLDKYGWSNEISFQTLFFLTKEDAKKEMICLNLTEGGCSHCGHGSTKVSTIVTEHEFVTVNLNIQNDK